MNRQKKEDVVAELKNCFLESQGSFLVNYQGLSVEQLQTLRRTLREKGGTFKVTKARLMKIAASDLSDQIDEIAAFRENFHDQVGLVFTKDSVSSVAKGLLDFSNKNEKLQIVSGLFESKFLSKESVKAIANLPSREVLLAMVAKTLQEPTAKFARLLQMLIARLPYALQQVNEKNISKE